ncbi:MAG: dual specificity protein phosphatase family protein [Acidobacteria bacterium]|nr:dual specificity protein phosphatase family protein [Acidobacteriota bacterium]
MILDCNEIIADRLWVGSYIRPEDVRSLRQLEITAILSLQSDQDLAFYNINLKKLMKAYAQADIELRRLPTTDFDKQTLAANLPRAVEELENALAPRWGRVYVHCSAGINRGPTLAAAYLIKVKGMSAQEAYDYIVARRDCSPYLDVLQEYEANLNRDRSG